MPFEKIARVIFISRASDMGESSAALRHAHELLTLDPEECTAALAGLERGRGKPAGVDSPACCLLKAQRYDRNNAASDGALEQQR